jgi:hypothetical protein
MKKIKFKQKVKKEIAKFYDEGIHYWGFFDGSFVAPVGNDAEKESFAFTGKTDIDGNEIYSGDRLSFPECWDATVIYSPVNMSFILTVNKSKFHDFAIISRGRIINE